MFICVNVFTIPHIPNRDRRSFTSNTSIMRKGSFACLITVLFLHSCAPASEEMIEAPGSLIGLEPSAPVDITTADIIQRTCALYVAVRSRAWQEEVSFDQHLDGSMVRWNICDDKIMVACVKTPTANGDTIRGGIPWPYGGVGL